MGYAVEVYFDKASEDKLMEYWRLLHQQGYSSYMYKHGGHPHIAFAVFDDNIRDIDNLKKIMVEYFMGVKPFDILFSNLGLFPTDEGVCFIAPKVSSQLLECHTGFYDKLCDYGYDEWFNEYYKPDVWIPHCTMTIKTDVRNQMMGLDLLRSVFKPFRAQIERVALVEFYPIKYLEVMELLL